MLSKLKSFARYSVPAFVHHPLWRNETHAPFMRFAKLQLRFALNKKKIKISWFEGLHLLIQREDTGLTGNYYLGLHEFEEMGFAMHILHEDDLFIDIGANLGSYGLIASGVAKAKTKSYEPVPDTYDRLVENISINNLNNRIQTYMIAITSESKYLNTDQLYFSTNRGCRNSFTEKESDLQKINVNISTLDRECNETNPVLIKIDVEGYEKDVVAGMNNTLRRESLLAVIIETNKSEIDEIFKSHGFKEVIYNPIERSLIDPQGQKNKLNKIWIKENKINEIKNRTKKAPLREIYSKKF